MKKIKLLYNIFLPLCVIALFFVIFSEDKAKDNSEAKILNTFLNSESINNQGFQNQNIIIKNPDFTVAAEKTINSVVHVKNTANSKSSNSLWD